MVDKDFAKMQIKALVDKYNLIVSEGKIKSYNEEMTKKDLILPLFRALGWDMENSNEVSAEEHVSKGRVDYSFRINGIPKFFLEAKAMKEDLGKLAFIEQAINYSYHKGCTWAVLTDFEEIKIYNAEWKTSGAFQNHLKTIKCSEFIDRFEELWLLSRGSFEQGLLDKEAEKWGKKTKKTSIDKQLLSDFTRFRELLSKDVLKLNVSKNLTEEELDESIQRILDRLIFIRSCEDRELDPKMLISALRVWESGQKGQLYTEIKKIFVDFDLQYNSKIFAKHLCDDLEVSNDILKGVVNGLYITPDRLISYDFSAIEADVLGNIYEQYLGHILKKTDKRASLSESKAKRKEQGIYYTPKYIVDYIVKNTLGERLKECKTKEDVEKLKILDPACGSGSFLIRAFDEVYDWYKAQGYDDEKLVKLLGDDAKGTHTVKDQILKNNIYGVDLDKQAVDIAQLNLLLKSADKKHRLQDLHKNVKNGNSLIDDLAVAGDKAFKWGEEFKEIMNKGGFDVIFGNPPYVDIKQIDSNIVKYFFSEYGTVENRMNLYAIFIEKALSLLKADGSLGFIIPSSLLYSESYNKIRKLLLNDTRLRKIVRLPDDVFGDAKVETIILIFDKTGDVSEDCELYLYPKAAKINLISKNTCPQIKNISQDTWVQSQNIINISASEESNTLISKLELETKPLVALCDFSLGITPYDKYKGHTKVQIENRVFHAISKKDETFKPLLSGSNIIRYGIFCDNKEYISYGSWLGAPRELRFFTKPRIIVRQIVSGKPQRIYAGYTDEELYNTQIGFNIVSKDESKLKIKYVLALFNSELMNYYHREKFLDQSKELFQKILIANAKTFPIKVIAEPKQQPFIEQVDKMLSLNKRLYEIGDKKTDERVKLEEDIKKTDNEIDQLVYNLYGLTPDEIKIVEESLKK